MSDGKFENALKYSLIRVSICLQLLSLLDVKIPRSCLDAIILSSQGVSVSTVNVTGIAHDIEIIPINEHSDYAVEIRKRNVFEKGKNSINFSYTVFSNRFES